MAKKEKKTEETPIEETVETPVEETAEAAPEVNPWEEKYNAEHDSFLRLAADYDNYRKRTAKEKETIYQDAKVDTVKAFLAVYDNLERAVKAGGDDDSPHKKGLEMIFQQYKDVLTKMGVTEMEALGKPFDPNRHNAVMHIDSDELGENVISEVFQAGFMMEDKVVRYAIVQVAN